MARVQFHLGALASLFGEAGVGPMVGLCCGGDGGGPGDQGSVDVLTLPSPPPPPPPHPPLAFLGIDERITTPSLTKAAFSVDDGRPSLFFCTDMQAFVTSCCVLL